MSKIIKVQGGVVTYSNTDTATPLQFNIGGKLSVGKLDDINALIQTPGNLNIVAGGQVTINGISWPPASSGSNPGGSTKQLQYNNGGSLGGTPNITWDSARTLLILKAANEHVLDLGNLGASLNQVIDVSVSNNFRCTAGGPITFTFIGAQDNSVYPTIDMISSATIFVMQDATGSRILTWPTGIYWQDGIVPEASVTPDTLDIYTFLTYDGGRTWIGTQSAKGLARVI